MADVPPTAYAPSPRPVWPLVLVGIAVVLLAVSVGAYFYLRDTLAPEIRQRSAVTKSLNHLRNLATLFAERANHRKSPPYTGKRFVLSLLADGVIDRDDPFTLEIFFSPADPLRRADAVPAERWREVTRAALDAGLDVDDLTSYVGPARRTEDPRPGRPMPAPILADLHFEDLALVAFADGSARALARDELGLGPEDPIVAGERSKSPLLRRLSAD